MSYPNIADFANVFWSDVQIYDDEWSKYRTHNFYFAEFNSFGKFLIALLAREPKNEKNANFYLRAYSLLQKRYHQLELDGIDPSTDIDYMLTRIILSTNNQYLPSNKYPFFNLLIHNENPFLKMIMGDGTLDEYMKLLMVGGDFLDYLGGHNIDYFDNWREVCGFISPELKKFAKYKSERYSPKSNQDDFSGLIQLAVERYFQHKVVNSNESINEPISYNLYYWVEAIRFVEKEIKGYNQDKDVRSIFKKEHGWFKNIFLTDKELEIESILVIENVHQKYLQSKNSVNFYDWYKVCSIINQVDAVRELDQSEIVNNQINNEELSDKIALGDQAESGVVTDL